MKKISLAFVFGLILCCASGCGALKAPTLPTNTLSPTSTMTPTTTTTPTETPLPTTTLTPTASPTPIGGSGELIIEVAESIFVEEGGITTVSEKNTVGIYRYILRDGVHPVIVGEYHLEGCSPAGDRLLISQDNNLFSINLDGSDIIELAGNFYQLEYRVANSAFWIPEHDRIVFLGTENGQTQVFLVNPDGKGLQSITSHPVNIIQFHSAFDEYIYWSQEGRYGGDFQTNIGSLQTVPFEPRLYTAAFSSNGNFLADYERGFINEPGLGYPDPNLVIRIRDIDGNIVQVIHLTEEYQIGISDYCAMVERVWWSTGGDKLLIKILLCDQRQIFSINEYYIFEFTGAQLSRVNLPEEEYRYSLPPDQEIFTYLSAPDTFPMMNPWSPDGRRLLFYSRLQGDMITADLDHGDYSREYADIYQNCSSCNIEKIFWLP